MIVNPPAYLPPPARVAHIIHPSTQSDSLLFIHYITRATPSCAMPIEWYDIKAPSFFENRNAGKTLVNRSQGLSALPSLFMICSGADNDLRERQ